MEEEWTLRESNLLLKVGGVRRRAAAVAPLLALIAFLSGCVVSACGSVPALVIGVRLEPDRASLQVGASARVQVSLIIQGWDGQAPAPYIGGGDGFRTVELYAVPPNALTFSSDAPVLDEQTLTSEVTVRGEAAGLVAIYGVHTNHGERVSSEPVMLVLTPPEEGTETR